MDNKQSQIRRKLNDNEIMEMKRTDSAVAPANDCKQIVLDKNEIENVVGLIGGGLWFENDWIDKFCECKDCNEQISNKYKLKWLFEECDNADDDVENNNNDQQQREQANVYDLNINPSQEITPEFSTDAMIADSITKLPRGKTLDALSIMLKGTDIIKQKLFEYVRLNPNKKIIDQNDIDNIFKT
eukprot:UN06324